MLEDFEDFCQKTVIAVTTFNRKKVTELCLKNINATKKGATLWVFDDHSTEYTQSDLVDWADDAVVVRLENKLGVDKLRMHIQQKAMDSSFKYVYHTDNDAYHDPRWMFRLYEMHHAYQMPLGLYNTTHHFGNTMGTGNGVSFRRACPGVSFFFEISKLTELPDKLYNSWDFVIGDKLLPFAISEISYVEHFGAGGIHNQDFERDRAHNPTRWLIAERERLLPIIKI